MLFVLKGRESAFWRSQSCSAGSTVKWVSDAQQHNFVHYGLARPHLFAFMDDYIIVSDIGAAQQAINILVTLLREFGVPNNPDKV